MAIEPLLETRTLIAAINDPELDAPEQFLIKSYWGAPKSTFSEYADIVVTKGSRGLARFRNLDQAGNVVGRVGKRLITVKMPYIREKKPITAKQIINPQAIGNVYTTGGGGIEQAKKEAIAADLVDLKNRILRREEWMASEILTKGIIQYEDEETSFEIDFQMPTSHKPVLSGGALWTASTATIVANLNAWSILIEQAVGAPGVDVILGTTAAQAFLGNAEVQALLHTNNLRVGQLQMDVKGKDLGSFNGLTFKRYSETYTDDDGAAADFFPSNGLLMVPASFKTHRLFGVIPEVSQVYADPFFSKSWEEPDPSVLWILGASRPLPIVEEAGSWVFATVTA